MNRRKFFSQWLARPDLNGGSLESRSLSTGLEPFVPDGKHPWNVLRAAHLLRRATFMPRWGDINALLGLTPSQAVDLLLNTPSAPAPPTCADNATEGLTGLDTTYQEIIKGIWRGDAQTLREWQVEVMKASGLSIAEKMTAFWSGHFTTEFVLEDDYVQAPLLYRQNKLYRDLGLGNFRELVKSVTLDGAMLVYLGGNLNSVGAPNENFGRELLELFTTGLGHYTEGDIQHAARILTGWRIGRYSDEPAPNGMFRTYFHAASHDINGKEFMTVSFPARDVTTNTEFIVRRDEIHRLIDVIFEKRQRAIAEFVCRKIYRYFVYSNPSGSDERVISAMADLFIQSNFDIKPVMSALLKSAHFFDNANIGAQIKTPAEFEIGLARQLGLAANHPGEMDRLGQDLFDPPNVSGWPGHHDWITTTTYPIRSEIAHRAVDSISEDSLLTLLSSLPNNSDVAKLTDFLCSLFLPRPLSSQRKTALMGKLLAGAPEYEWADILESSPSTAARNLRDMLTTIVDLPDFQLC